MLAIVAYIDKGDKNNWIGIISHLTKFFQKQLFILFS